MKPPEFQFNFPFMPIHTLTPFEKKTTIDTDNKLILCFGREKNAQLNSPLNTLLSRWRLHLSQAPVSWEKSVYWGMKCLL